MAKLLCPQFVCGIAFMGIIHNLVALSLTGDTFRLFIIIILFVIFVTNYVAVKE